MSPMKKIISFLKKGSIGLILSILLPAVVFAVTTIGANISTEGTLTVSGSGTSTFSTNLAPTSNNSVDLGNFGSAWRDVNASGTMRVSGPATISGRLDAKYLNRRFVVPLLYQTIDGRRATTTVGTSPQGLAFDGTHLWVANYGSNNVSKIDINTNAVVATITVGTIPQGVAFDGSHIWVTNGSSNNVSKIDVNTNAVVATITVGTGPQGIAFDGTHIWAANYTSGNNVSKIDINTNSVVATITVGSNPLGVAFDGSNIWVTNYSSANVSKININTNAVVATTTVGTGPEGIAFDGTRIWVANYDSGNVSKIDINTNVVVATTTVGTNPNGIAFDGTHMWVANYGSGNVSKIDTNTNAVVATITVGTGPFGVAFDGSHVWVTNSDLNNVSKLNIGGSFGANYIFNTNLRPETNNSNDIGVFGNAFKDIYASGTLRLSKQAATTTLNIASNSTTAGQGTCIPLRAADGTLLYLSATGTPPAAAPWQGLVLSTASCE